MKGTTKFFIPKKGYGFISGEDGKDYFVHQSNIQMDGFRKLKTDQSVTFDAEVVDGRERAVNVVPN